MGALSESGSALKLAESVLPYVLMETVAIVMPPYVKR